MTAAVPPSSEPSGRGRGRGRLLAGALRWLVVVATVAALVQVGSSRVDQLDEVNLRLAPGWLALAAVPVGLASVVLPLAWRRLLAAWDVHLGRLVAIRIWAYAQATRYLPTGIVALASRMTLSADAGVRRSVAAASFVVETVLLVTWAAFLGLILVPSSIVPAWVRTLGALGAAVALVLVPVALVWGRRLLGRIRRPAIEERIRPLVEQPASVPVVAEASAMFGINVALRLLSSVFVTAAVLPIGADDAARVAGVVALAAVIGILGVTPAGLGVREGVIAALLADSYGLGDATAVAVVLRLWDFAVELLVLGVVTVAARRARPSEEPFLRRSVPETETQQRKNAD